MEDNLREALKEADAQAAREQAARDEACAAAAPAAQEAQATALVQHAETKAVLAEAATLEMESNCSGTEGADTGKQKYNPHATATSTIQQHNFDWKGEKQNKTTLHKEPWRHGTTEATKSQPGSNHKTKLLLEQQPQERPPPERGRTGSTSEGAKRQRVSINKKKKINTINWVSRGCVRFPESMYPMDTIRYPV